MAPESTLAERDRFAPPDGLTLGHHTKAGRSPRIDPLGGEESDANCANSVEHARELVITPRHWAAAAPQSPAESSFRSANNRW